MKKLSFLIVGILSSLIFTVNVMAATATVSVNANSTKIVVGNTVKVTVSISSASALGSWEYSLNYDKSMMSLTKSDVSLHYAFVASNSNTKNVSYAYTFKALKSGTAEFYITSAAVIGWDENDMTIKKTSDSVQVLTQVQLEATYSKDNYLKDLVAEGYTITPAFNKDTLEYALELEPLTEKVNIIATKNDSRSSVDGSGERSLTVGLNKLNVVVTAQNGSKRTYVVNITVKELKPINVKVNNVDYTVVRNLDQITKPDTYEASTILIDGEVVPVLINKVTSYTLVLLKDATGSTKFFLYNAKENTYETYQALNISGLSIRVLEPDTKLNKYFIVKETINGEAMNVLKLDKKSPYSLINGINLETNEKGLYSYESKDLTLQKYNNDEVKKLEKDVKDYLLLIIIFASSSIILLGTLIMMLVKSKNKNKSNKKVKEVKKDEDKKEEPIREEKKENQKTEKKPKKKDKDNLDEWFEG